MESTMERLAFAEDGEIGIGDSSPLTDNLRARMMSELEKWPQLQEAIACSREREKQINDRPELLSVDLLILADAHIALSEALLLDPRLFVSLLRESIAIQGIRQRMQVRPVMRASASNLVVMFSGMPSGLREVVGRVISLQSQEQAVYSRLVRCTNSFCHDGKAPFTLTSNLNVLCPHCASHLAEDCRSRVMHAVKVKYFAPIPSLHLLRVWVFWVCIL